jgi:hypothetical protein
MSRVVKRSASRVKTCWPIEHGGLSPTQRATSERLNGRARRSARVIGKPMSRDDLVSAPRGEIVDLDNARLVGDDFAWRLFTAVHQVADTIAGQDRSSEADNAPPT